MLSDILGMLKKLKAAIIVFVRGQLDPIFFCMVTIHAQLMNYKDYIMIFLSIYLKPLWTYCSFYGSMTPATTK